MPRVLSKEMAVRAEAVETNQKIFVNTMSTSTMGLNIILGLSLKYLWAMINMLQFVIYMNEWKVNWPANANLAIQTLRTIALGEFFDTTKITNGILNFYGIYPGTDEVDEARRILDESNQDQESQVKLEVKTNRIVISVLIVGVIGFTVCFVTWFFYKTNQTFKKKFLYWTDYAKQ